METQTGTSATVYGLVSGLVLSNIPTEWLSYGEKLLWGAALALVTGFAYAAGGWVWLRLFKKGS